MREYRIKRGYNPDLDSLITKYFGANGDIRNGINFEVEGIGKIEMKCTKNSLFIDIEPPKKVLGDYNIIKNGIVFYLKQQVKIQKKERKNSGKLKNKFS